MAATVFISAIVISDVANKTIGESLEEWQLGFLIIIGCFSGGMAGLFLFAELEWNTLVGFVLGVGLAFLIASYVFYRSMN